MKVQGKKVYGNESTNLQKIFYPFVSKMISYLQNMIS